MATIPTGQNRLQGVDFCRSSAILIAMFSHSLAASGLRDFDSSGPLMAVLFIIHFAAPTFIALFGAMLEIAYLSRIRSGQGAAAVSRLMSRTLQCYLLYALSVLALHAAIGAAFGDTLRRVLLFGYMPFTDILRFYVYALLLAPLLLAARNRFGLAPLLILAALAQASYPLLAAIPQIPEMTGGYYVHYLANALYGAAGDNQVPSLIHGLSLVVFGMAVGNIATNWRSEELARRRGALALYAVLLTMTAAATAAMWNWTAPGATIEDLALGVLRGLNHPLYYSSAAVGILIAVALASYLLDVRKMRFAKPVLFAGRTSLFTFSFGNILLFFAPPLARSAGEALAYTFVLFALICLQSWFFDWAKSARPNELRVSAPFVRRFQGMLAAMSSAVSGLVKAPSRNYSRMLKLA
jgi:surface polysaccharide O-acyltransferase-like enzyme